MCPRRSTWRHADGVEGASAYCHARTGPETVSEPVENDAANRLMSRQAGINRRISTVSEAVSADDASVECLA
jgi:hypothetical protein